MLVDSTVSLNFPDSLPSRMKNREEQKIQAKASEEFLNLLFRLFPEGIADFVEEATPYLERLQDSKAGVSDTDLDLAAAITGERPNFNDDEYIQMELESLIEFFKWRRELLKGSLTSRQVADLLGSSRQTPHDRLRSGSLIAALDNGSRRFPMWQFDSAGPDGVIQGLPEVVRVLRISDLSKISWLKKPNAFLDGHTPVDALKQGRVKDVIAEASRVGADSWSS